MAFLAPLVLTGLLLVSLPVIVHLLVRRRGRSLDFPSIRFLLETPSFKLYPRRVRQPLLLALRVAAIVLLVMGLARPLLTFRTHAAMRARFILMDASLSMRSRGRAEAAREQARLIINKLAEGERAMILSLSSEARALTELTLDKESLLQAVEQYRPSGGGVDYAAGFGEVESRLRREPQAETHIDFVSDFQQAGLDEQLKKVARARLPFRVMTYPVGAAAERNAFLADERAAQGEHGIEVSASEMVSEAGSQSGTRRVWAIDKESGASPGLEWRTELNGQLTGRLSVLEPDEFDADDERFFAFEPPRPQHVLLIEDGGASLYLRAALEAGMNSQPKASFTLDTRAELPGESRALGEYSLIVMTLHGAADEKKIRSLTEYARGGGVVWMLMGRDLDAASWSALAGSEEGWALPFESVSRPVGKQALSFAAMDADTPTLRGLGLNALDALGAVRASDAYSLVPRATADTLLRWSDTTPAFVSARVGKGTILLLATSPERGSSELGLSPAFPTLVNSILRSEAAVPLSQTIGEAVRLKVAPETAVKIRGAEGRTIETQARELVHQPLAYFSEPGIYELEFAGGRQFIAFNAPAGESSRALATAGEAERLFASKEVEKKRAFDEDNLREAMEQNSSVWRYFLTASFLLMIAELFVALKQRKVAQG